MRKPQKGTIGMIYNQEDMPYTSDGIVPDLIVNPHAIPSRMTIGQLMETILGKACVLNGNEFGDSTPFTDLKVDDIAKILAEHNIEKYGNEVMYNPRTGEQIHTCIFVGPTYYQRLKHMVSDKINILGLRKIMVMLQSINKKYELTYYLNLVIHLEWRN